MDIVRALQLAGTHVSSYQQYDKIRKIKVVHSNMFELSSRASEMMVTFRGAKGEVTALSWCPTQSLLFTHFSKDLLESMGKVFKSDLALDYMILQCILDNLDGEFRDGVTSLERKREVTVLATYLVIYFLYSLRGNEGFMVELGGLNQHIYYS